MVIFKTHFRVVKLPLKRLRLLRGGRCTPWPWCSLQIGRRELVISRTRPLQKARHQ